MNKPAPEVLDTPISYEDLHKLTKKLNDRITLTMFRCITYTGKKVTRTSYKFGSSCHWSEVASLTYLVAWNGKVSDSINWSSGGCNDGFTVEEYALAQAGIFKWVAQVARKHAGKVTK